MRFRRPKSKLEKHLHKWSLATLLLTLFFCESPDLNSVSSSANLQQKKYTAQRLPASLQQQVFDFDCNKPHTFTQLSTQFETIRLNTKNCKTKPEVTNQQLNQKLLTFASSSASFSSEYAYLSRGENLFTIIANSKEYKISIIRY